MFSLFSKCSGFWLGFFKVIFVVFIISSTFEFSLILETTIFGKFTMHGLSKETCLQISDSDWCFDKSENVFLQLMQTVLFCFGEMGRFALGMTRLGGRAFAWAW